MFRKFSIGLVVLTFLSVSVLAQSTIENLLKHAQEAQKNYQEWRAISIYKQVLQKDSANATALFNIAYLYQRQGWLEEGINDDKSKEYYQQCFNYSEKSFALYPNSFEANLIKAGAIARMARFYDAKGRVQAAWDIKKYADIAMKMNPNHPEILHMLAWWNYELTKPTWLERKLAQVFFGGMPKGASMDNAFQMLQKATSMNPNYIVYYYDLAVFFQHIGNKMNAIENLKKAISLKPIAPEE